MSGGLGGPVNAPDAAALVQRVEATRVALALSERADDAASCRVLIEGLTGEGAGLVIGALTGLTRRLAGSLAAELGGTADDVLAGVRSDLEAVMAAQLSERGLS